ncbi:golgin putative 5 [Rhynchospora pubera]|uniref:Golgin putative 5 n=1 Tax=Rhynchospora pubera TaxID=906938 RepID=A0AAV8G1Q4_9POAL|nr:golgin putative 5 [Rhynchospora pubera]
MAWFGKVSLGGLQDLAGAVNKISESVKNIEKNFDTALGLEDKPDSEQGSGAWGAMPDFMGFMGQQSQQTGDEDAQVSDQTPTLEHSAPASQQAKETEETVSLVNHPEEAPQQAKDQEPLEETVPSENIAPAESVETANEKDSDEVEQLKLAFEKEVLEVMEDAVPTQENVEETTSVVEREATSEPDSQEKSDAAVDKETEPATVESSLEASDNAPSGEARHESVEKVIAVVPDVATEEVINPEPAMTPVDASDVEPAQVEPKREDSEKEYRGEEGEKVVPTHDSNNLNTEMEKLKKEMKMMEAALQGAARQAQAKADEMTRLMNENDQLKSTIEDLKRRSMESEVDSLKEEYHQRVASLERKVYALTKERDTLRREQNKKSDAAALLKEKDEIINQVMAEGEELSKKQAAQEATIRKLRAQIREFEEEKQRLNSKLQVEEAKVESIKRDKAATEKLLQETIEKNQAELAAQKEFYANALNAAKEAEAVAEARANSEAKVELETRLREASEKEAILVQTIEELRHTLTRKEQEAAFKEEMFKRDLDDLQKRYQASELRYNELVTQVPESTRPLLRQIEAMQETAARRAEAWAGVERALNSRLQDAEAKAAAAEEKERTLNERLSQTLSRITILETQITCLRTEQTQLSRSLEKERQRASESRQEYLAIKEEAATQEGRAKQLEDEIRELRTKHKKELQEVATHRELLEKELERERATRLELEKAASMETHKTNHDPTRNIPMRKLSSAGSLNSIEESHFLQASLENDSNALLERRMSTENSMSSYYLKSMTPSAFEAALRQKDGELASYMARLASLESTRDSLAEELVKLTEQCEKLKVEAAALPGVKAELEALRQRHTAALELMGERDEELEELRADIVDLKEMYREQVDLLVNKIQMLGASA